MVKMGGKGSELPLQKTNDGTAHVNRTPLVTCICSHISPNTLTKNEFPGIKDKSLLAVSMKSLLRPPLGGLLPVFLLLVVALNILLPGHSSI